MIFMVEAYTACSCSVVIIAHWEKLKQATGLLCQPAASPRHSCVCVCLGGDLSQEIRQTPTGV